MIRAILCGIILLFAAEALGAILQGITDFSEDNPRRAERLQFLLFASDLGQIQAASQMGIFMETQFCHEMGSLVRIETRQLE